MNVVAKECLSCAVCCRCKQFLKGGSALLSADIQNRETNLLDKEGFLSRIENKVNIWISKEI